MKVLDAILEAYASKSDEFKKYINRAYKYVSTHRARVEQELVSKNAYKVTITLHNGLSYSVKRKDIKEAEWICWYKLIELLAIAEHWFTYKYRMVLNNYTILTYMLNGKPINYGKRIGFRRAKFVNRYESERLKKGTQPSLF